MRSAFDETGAGGSRPGHALTPALERALTRREFALAVCLLMAGMAALLFPRLGVAPLERAEIYFLDGARSMVERGDYLVPYYRGQPFFDKPVLTYGLMALAFHALGVTAAAARVVPALAALLTTAAALWLGVQLFGRRAAFAGGVILCSSVAFVGFGRVAMSDMLLALWTTLGMALGVAAYRRPERRWPLPLLGIVLGLGFQTKGPVALLLPGLGLMALAWTRRGEKGPLSVPRVALATALAAVVGLSWFVAVQQRLGWEPLRYFFLSENLGRFAGETYDTGRAWWFYLATYLVEGAPWSWLFPLALFAFLGRGPAATSRGARLLLAWVGLMLIPLSLSRGKIDYYLLPLFPPLCLVLGAFLARGGWRRWERAWVRGVLAVTAVSLATTVRLISKFPAEWLPSALVLQAVALLAALGVVALLAVALRPAPDRVMGALGGSVAVMFLLLAGFFLAPFRERQPNAEIVQDVGRELAYEPAADLVFCDDPVRVQRDVLFELRLAARSQCDLWSPVASRRPYLFLLRESEWSLAAAPRMRHVATYSYLPAKVFGIDGLLKPIVPGRLALYANFRTKDPVALHKFKREFKREYRAMRRANVRLRERKRLAARGLRR